MVLLALTTLACAPSEDATTSAESSPSQVEATPTSASAIVPDWCARLPRPAYASLSAEAASDGWFEVYRVGEGVFAIYEPRQWQEVISYLILGDEQALLFDTGMGIAAISEVVADLTTHPVTVLNSHTHMDHVGGNAEFQSIIGMDTEFTRSRAGGLPNARVREEISGDAVCGPLPEGVGVDGYTSRPFTITEIARDGHSIDLGGRTLTILHIPGHTPDAIALHDESAGYLWTGDSFYEGPIWLFAPETHLERYRESVARLAGLAPDLERVFPAHNTPVAEPVRLVELRDVLEGAIAGTMQGESQADGLVRYDAEAFSLLMRAR